jgi:hypothetical protein
MATPGLPVTAARGNKKLLCAAEGRTHGWCGTKQWRKLLYIEAKIVWKKVGHPDSPNFWG